MAIRPALLLARSAFLVCAWAAGAASMSADVVDLTSPAHRTVLAALTARVAALAKTDPAAAAALWRRELREHFGYEGPLSGVVPIVATGSLQVVAVTPLRSYDLAMLDRLRRGAPLSGIPIQRDVVVMVVPVPASAVAVRAVALTVNGRTVAETRSDLKVGQPGLVGFPLREFSTGTTLVFTVSLIRGDPFVRAVGPHELMRLR